MFYTLTVSDSMKEENMNDILMRDRFLGCLLGLAVGDALGAPIEFEKRDTYQEITSYRSGGPFNLKAGQWTDDTSLALCLGYSLLEKKQFDAADIMKRFFSWWKEGYMSCTGHCFDIGNTTKAALARFEEKGALFSGAESDPATNGSIMRLGAVPLFYFDDLEKSLFFSRESSRLTHAPVACLDACRGLALFIHRALKGQSKQEILAYEKDMLPNLCPEIESVLLGSYKYKTREEISSAGLAHTCLEAALWAFYHSDNFDAGVFLAVNLGEDSDTTGAVFGQLAGAFYGIRGIRQDLLVNLWDKNLIEDLALKLYQHYNPFFYEGENPTVDLIVINPQDEVLLVRRSANSQACPGMLAFPGGFIDSHAKEGEKWVLDCESPPQAAVRELAEETNLKLNSPKMIFVGQYVGNGRDPRDNSTSWSKTHAFLYLIDKDLFNAQKDAVRGMDDADEALWMPVKDARKNVLAFDHNQILEDALKIISYK